MRKLFDRKNSAVTLKAVASLFAFVFTAVFCLAFSGGEAVKADTEVTISAVTKRTDVGPGDIIIVDVVANCFPDISEFGPIEFNFDADKAEYVSFEQGHTELTKTGTDLTITTSSRGTITDSNIVLVLTQEETAMFNLKQAVNIQVNWINASGVREATEMKRIGVFRNLLDKVIAYGD